MKGLFTTGLALAALTAVAAGPLGHSHGRRHHMHHDEKRELVVVTRTQEVVEVDYFTKTVYVDEVDAAKGHATRTHHSHESSSSVIVSTTSSSVVQVLPPPPPPSTTSSSSSTSTSSPSPPPPSSAPVAPPASPVPTTQPIALAPAPSPSAPAPAPVIAPPPQNIPSPSPSPSPSPAPVVAPSTSGSNASPIPNPAGGWFLGNATFYAAGMGSCGVTNSDSDMIAALSASMMTPHNGGNPNNNPVCGNKVKVALYDDVTGANAITVSIMDTCPGCPGTSSLDLTPTAFNRLGNAAQGVLAIRWSFV